VRARHPDRIGTGAAPLQPPYHAASLGQPIGLQIRQRAQARMPVLLEIAQQAQQVRGQHGERCARHLVLRMYDDVPSRRYLQAMTAHDLSNPPPHAIAHHRAAQSLFDAEAETALRLLVGAKKNSEVGTGAALSGAVYGVKFSPPHQPRRAGELQARITRA
jgi:hypothetical protein